MSRTTDVHRGALIALQIAEAKTAQPDLFGTEQPDEQFWLDITHAAVDQLDEIRWCAEIRA